MAIFVSPRLRLPHLSRFSTDGTANAGVIG